MADRDSNGRFTKGNKAAVGNRGGRPRRQVEEHYLGALSDSIKDDEWNRIVRKAVSQALQGDRYARDWLANYLIGRPTQYEAIDLQAHDPLADLLADIQSALTDKAGEQQQEDGDADDA